MNLMRPYHAGQAKRHKGDYETLAEDTVKEGGGYKIWVMGKSSYIEAGKTVTVRGASEYYL